MPELTSYKNILKSTALFGVVQIFNIIVKAATNKIVAIMLGAEGVGIMGIFNSSTNMIKTGAGLGISQSAVKDISEAYSTDNQNRLTTTFNVVRKVVLFTALLGVIVTIAFSSILSRYSFGNGEYTYAFIILSLAVGMGIFSEGQLAILKGARRLRDLAKASMAGSVAGFIVAVPFFKIWGVNGLAPSLVVTALAALIFSNYYVRKISVNNIKIRLKEIFVRSKNMIAMGMSLMIISFIAYLFDIIVSAYINRFGSMEIVGYYHAGATIVGAYFGIVLTAMTTDYYPRIAAISDNKMIQSELNRQAEIGLLIIFPLVLMFNYFAKYFVEILYDGSFYPVIPYLDYALLGTIFIVVSNCMDIVLLTKQEAKLYLISSLFIRLLILGIYIYFYDIWGLEGLGCGRIVMGVLHLTVMWIIMKIKFNITLSPRIILLTALVLLFAIASIYLKEIEVLQIRVLLSFLLLFSSIMISVIYCRHFLGFNLLQLIYRNFTKIINQKH